jgi:ketosteroid isomerase-like protein
MIRVIASISLLLFAAVIVFSQDQAVPPALASLAATERAFARTSVEKGFRESFLTFFADDGVFFQPHPVKAKETLRARPARPQTFTLNWEPIFGDVSDAGDLGFTTGPYTLSDNSSQNSPPQHGCFFSVWKVQSDGSWKVVIDAGISTPGPLSSVERPLFRAARHPQSKQKIASANLESERMSLMELDRELLRTISKTGMTNAFSTVLDDEARLHRTGLLPLLGKESIKSYLAQNRMEVSWEPIASDIAKSVDLGYTYGRYQGAVIGDASIKEVQRGYYVRVWRRDAAGRWKLMLDTVSPVPPEER